MCLLGLGDLFIGVSSSAWIEQLVWEKVPMWSRLVQIEVRVQSGRCEKSSSLSEQWAGASANETRKTISEACGLWSWIRLRRFGPPHAVQGRLAAPGEPERAPSALLLHSLSQGPHRSELPPP